MPNESKPHTPQTPTPSNKPKKQYTIALVLAGAVSAGAYTGGALDYLFNTLRLWQDEYEKNPDKVPEPNVTIKAMTGASAGSIAGVIALLNLYLDRKLDFSSVNESVKESLQYESWVKLCMDENENKNIIDSLFDLSDIKDGNVDSLLNSSFIDKIIETLNGYVPSNPSDKDRELPKYINSALELLLSITNLRGVPIDLKLSNEKESGAHRMTYHKILGHFQLAKQNARKDTFPLDIFKPNQRDLLFTCARASGAFPLGLEAVPIKDFPTEYVEAQIRKTLGSSSKIEINLDRCNKYYEFLAVDGGVVNNEPLAEAQELFSEEEQENSKIIMIDPFPSKLKDGPYNIEEKSILKTTPHLFQTFRDQTLFKEKDVDDLFADETNKHMIWPTRYERKGDEIEKVDNPLACGALGGFSGFFDERFRHHDYYLGAKNCQNFLRKYFTQSEEDIDHWSDEMKEKFKYVDKYKNTHYPIIPDFNCDKDIKDSTYLYHDANFPKFPQVDHEEIISEKFKDLVQARVNMVFKRIGNEASKKDDNSEKETLKRYHQPPLIKQKFINKVISLLLFIFMRKPLRNKILNTISDELVKFKLIKEKINFPPNPF